MSDSVEVDEDKDEITDEKKENMEAIIHQDNADELGQDSVESEPDEDPVFYEEERGAGI